MFKVKIISPKLTGCVEEKYEIFNVSLQKELKKYTNDIVSIEDENFFPHEDVDENCAIVIYNYKAYEELNDFLINAQEKKAKIYPVAMNKDGRKPIEAIIRINSFDVYEELRKRTLSKEYMASGLEAVSLELARCIICDMQPVLSQKDMNCFLSHRRSDGEDIAAEVDYVLRAWGEKCFRDLNSILVGEDAENVIEEKLKECDTVIFFDTPDVSNSPWVKREIDMAQLFNIPIVWVKLHDKDSYIRPADKPHVVETNFKELTEQEKKKFVDKIYYAAFELHRMNAVKILGYISSFKKLHNKGKIEFKQIDERKNIYEVKMKRTIKRYREVPCRHFVQFFGRRPNVNDKNALNNEFLKKYFNCSNMCENGYDIAVLAGPCSDRNGIINNCQAVVVDGVQEYVSEVRRLVFCQEIKSKNTRNIILSGAFPEDIDAIYQQRLVDAVSVFSRVILDRGCSISCGSHPTFTPIIMKIGEDRLGEARKEKVNMYMSKFFEKFLSKEEIEECRRNTSLIMVDMDKDQSGSLTKMREAMIKESSACALIVLGGKTADNGHKAGVDEEINLAKEADIPVFIVGSTGGRAYEIAAEYNKQKWKIGKWIPNGMQPEENKKLLISTDFEELADMILTNLGF